MSQKLLASAVLALVSLTLPVVLADDEKKEKPEAAEKPEAKADETPKKDDAAPKKEEGDAPKKEEAAAPKKEEAEAKPEAKTEEQPLDKDAEKEARKAAKDAEKAARETEKAAEKAAKDAEKEAKKAAAAEAKKSEVKVADKNAKCPNCGKKMKNCICPPVVVDAAAKLAAVELAREKLESERRISAAISRLTTSGWREAYAHLVENGRASVPHLIEAMGNNEKPAYQLGAHTKADAGRATRQRTQAEVCCEVLTEIVKHRSTFRGEVPTVDQQAWQEWWTANQGTVVIGN